MIERVLGARRAVLFISTAVVIGSIWAASSLSFDPNNRVFFSSEHEHFGNLQDLEARFESSTNLFFLIASDRSIFEDPETGASIRWLSEEVWRIEKVVSVESIANFPLVSDDTGELVVHNLLDFVCPKDQQACLSERSASLQKLHIVNRLVDEDARDFSVIAKVDLSDPSTEDVVHIAEKAKELVGAFESRFPDQSLYLTGGVPMMYAFLEAAMNDSGSLIILVVVLLSVGLLVFLGGVLPTLIMISLGLASIAVAMGVAGSLGWVINTATATVPLVVFTLVVASAMHIFLHIVREERLESRSDVQRATRVAVTSNVRPVVLTALTTAIGLLSMAFVSAPPLRELGILSAVGVASGAILSFTVVPCLFSYLPRLRTSPGLLWVQASMNEYAKWLERVRPRMVIALVFFVIALAGLFRVHIDEDFVRYFSNDTSFRQDTESITEHLAGPYHIDIVYESGESAGIYSAQSIRDISFLIQRLRQHPDVVNVLSIVDVLREVGGAMSGARDLEQWTPEVLAQYFLSYELSLNIGQSTKDLMDSDHRRSRISVLLNDVSMADIRRLVTSIGEWAEAGGYEDKVTISGEGVPTAYLSIESIREMAVGIAFSVVISAILVGLYFCDWKASLSIFAATAIPILAGFGIWGWVESDIGMAATLVVAITIGVVIDDTIHLTYRYVDSLRNLDLTPWGATAYSIHKTGTAIVVTSVVLAVGLLVLVVSDFRMNSTFGVCSALIVALALLYNLSVAPKFLNYLR